MIISHLSWRHTALVSEASCAKQSKLKPKYITFDPSLSLLELISEEMGHISQAKNRVSHL